jgi:hypothetical protein
MRKSYLHFIIIKYLAFLKFIYKYIVSYICIIISCVFMF